MSLFYTIALILNLTNRIRYIKTHQPKKWSKLALVIVKKLWERYKEEVVPLQSYLAFSYNNPAKPKELDTFDQIALSLRLVAQLTSEDEYKDYNSQDLHSPRKGGALQQWLLDA